MRKRIPEQGKHKGQRIITDSLPLRKIPDNYEKIVIAIKCDIPGPGQIKIVSALDFLPE